MLVAALFTNNGGMDKGTNKLISLLAAHTVFEDEQTLRNDIARAVMVANGASTSKLVKYTATGRVERLRQQFALRPETQAVRAAGGRGRGGRRGAAQAAPAAGPARPPFAPAADPAAGTGVAPAGAGASLGVTYGAGPGPSHSAGLAGLAGTGAGGPAGFDAGLAASLGAGPAGAGAGAGGSAGFDAGLAASLGAGPAGAGAGAGGSAGFVTKVVTDHGGGGIGHNLAFLLVDHEPQLRALLANGLVHQLHSADVAAERAVVKVIWIATPARLRASFTLSLRTISTSENSSGPSGSPCWTPQAESIGVSPK